MQSTKTPSNKKLIIIKLGGSCITNKQKLHTLNEDAIDWCSKQIAHLYKKNIQMIIIHGAGSFGHFEAKEFNLSFGMEHPLAPLGISKTRIAVTTLHHHVLSTCSKYDIPIVGISPFLHYQTSNGKLTKTISKCEIQKLLNDGIIPILHGDVVLDDRIGCTILGGDTLMEHLSELFKPNYVVFLTNVWGIYKQIPKKEDDELDVIQQIFVTKNGEIFYGSTNKEIKFSLVEHDVTGGIERKMKHAISIAKNGIPVFITKCESDTSSHILLHGELLPNHKATQIQRLDFIP